MSAFIKKENIHLLWDVLLDELGINTNSSYIETIRIVFNKNITLFSSKLNPNSSLISANKHFLSQMVLAINKLFPNLKEEQKKLINIGNEVLEPYTIEDLQNQRQTIFVNDYEKRKNEFDSLINKPKPKEINLSYENTDEKIKSMDNLVADKMAEREYNTYIPEPSQDVKNWLQPQETSMKPNNQPMTIDKTNTGSKLKYLNLDNSNNITLNVVEKKKVTWEDVSDNNTTSTNNIFSKLKTVPSTLPIQNDPSIIQYEEQKSMPLPSGKQQTTITRDTMPITPITSTTPVKQEPLISNSQVIKQIGILSDKIDDLTNKLDNIFNLVSQLVSIKSNTCSNNILEDFLAEE